MSDHERKENGVSLAGNAEVIEHRHSVDVNDTLARLHSSNCARGLSLTEAPSCAAGIELSFTLLLRKGASEIVQVDSFELRNVTE